ncbi:MAG: efflux RND transporter permease subunit [Terrimicrobiaceae bacterium]
MGEAFPAIRYTVAVLLVGAALVTTIALRKSFHAAYYQTPFFFCAIVLSSWFGGFGSGICSTLLSIFVFDLFFAQPLYSPGFSPSDPFVIIMALPGALCGIVWMLFATGTTLNVPSLMGAIMAIGVATANSILLVTFSNGESRAGKNAREAALSAGRRKTLSSKPRR